ncbi:MAG: hypothetical protein IJ147_07250 [Lachnospiraceae bacterium]|nr:hypothetical protein [Lachnospiraceae bacterium]
MEGVLQNADAAKESAYQTKLEEAREYEKKGERDHAETGYQALTAEYPEKFGAWWAYARFHMERLIEQEPCPPYHEIDLESPMLTKALSVADHSQQLFIKQRIAEYKAAWAVKCEESAQRTREALKEYRDFEHFVENFHVAYESAHDSTDHYFKLLRHGRRALYFEKVSKHDAHKTDIVKYTYNNWIEHNYRLTGLFDAADFDLYVKDLDGDRVVLVYVYMEEKVQKHKLIELIRQK